MVLTVMAESKSLDVIVGRNQRIRDVCERLSENGYIPRLCEGRRLLVYSVRREEYIASGRTFGQEGIYNGDILRIE